MKIIVYPAGCVFIAPSRNWNLIYPSMYPVSPCFYRTIEELKYISRCRQRMGIWVFIAPSRNWNCEVEGIIVSSTEVFIAPSRNWNFDFRPADKCGTLVFIAPSRNWNIVNAAVQRLYPSFYRTIEELKLFGIIVQSNTEKFLSHHRGIEMYKKRDEVPHSLVFIAPSRNWNGPAGVMHA